MPGVSGLEDIVWYPLTGGWNLKSKSWILYEQNIIEVAVEGGVDEPRLPVCYCGQRRYCDETCQRAGWAAEHSKTCLFDLTAEQIALLQRLEECYSHEIVTDVQYSHFREEYLKMTPAEAQDMFEKARQHMPDGFFSGGPCQWA